MNDVNATGLVSKDDFLNVVFDHVKQIKPSELMHLATSVIESEGDKDVRYEDFLHLISLNGEIDGLDQQQRQMSAQKQGFFNGRPSERQLRDSIDKVKVGVSEATGGLMGV